MKATLQFLQNKDQHAEFIVSLAGDEVREHEGSYQNITVQLEDARNDYVLPTIDLEGFELVDQPTKVTNFYQAKQIKQIYEAELQRLLKDHLGAKQVDVFDHTCRSTSQKNREQKHLREPVHVVHNDYSSESGEQRLQDYLLEHPSKTHPNYSHFAIVNVWRSMAGVVKDHTLALCDASSVGEGDLVPIQRKSEERTGEIQFAVFNPNQRWYHVPNLEADEALIFKTFDSAEDGRARFTPHASFSQSTEFIRESIESRCFVFF